MSPSFTTAEALRAALASTIACSAQELQEAVGQVVVATAAECPAAGPDDRSLSDPATRNLVLLADRIPAGQEAQALAVEIVRSRGRAAAEVVLGDRADDLLGSEQKAGIEFKVIEAEPGRSLRAVFLPKGEPISDGLFGDAQTDMVELSDLRYGVCRAVKYLDVAVIEGIRQGNSYSPYVGATISGDDCQRLAAWVAVQKGQKMSNHMNSTGEEIKLRANGTQDFGAWQKGAFVTAISQLEVGQKIVNDSDQFDAVNLCEVTNVDVVRGIAYAKFIDPLNPHQLRSGANADGFAIWDSELQSKAQRYSFAFVEAVADDVLVHQNVAAEKNQKYRVLGAHANGNFFDIEAVAKNGLGAFGVAARMLKEADEEGDAEFFAALPAGTEFAFPGDSVVTLETVLDPEQADVFGLNSEQLPHPGKSGFMAYQATSEDVENVLRSNSLAVANTNGKSFESMADELFDDLNFFLIEKAALHGDGLDEQTNYANDEIARQLREKGVLEPLKQAYESPSPGM